MHSHKHAAAGLPPGDLHPDTASGPSSGTGTPPPDYAAGGNHSPRRRPRRGGRRAAGLWQAGLSPIDRKRLAAAHVKKAFARIDADFSEAYEQCRNDAQRKALELAHRSAKLADLRAREEPLLDDREGWRGTRAEFRAEKARADRALARLATASAVMRIRKRLASIEVQLAVLAA